MNTNVIYLLLMRSDFHSFWLVTPLSVSIVYPLSTQWCQCQKVIVPWDWLKEMDFRELEWSTSCKKEYDMIIFHKNVFKHFCDPSELVIYWVLVGGLQGGWRDLRLNSVSAGRTLECFWWGRVNQLPESFRSLLGQWMHQRPKHIYHLHSDRVKSHAEERCMCCGELVIFTCVKSAVMSHPYTRHSSCCSTLKVSLQPERWAWIKPCNQQCCSKNTDSSVFLLDYVCSRMLVFHPTEHISKLQQPRVFECVSELAEGRARLFKYVLWEPTALKISQPHRQWCVCACVWGRAI